MEIRVEEVLSHTECCFLMEMFVFFLFSFNGGESGVEETSSLERPLYPDLYPKSGVYNGGKNATVLVELPRSRTRGQAIGS